MKKKKSYDMCMLQTMSISPSYHFHPWHLTKLHV